MSIIASVNPYLLSAALLMLTLVIYQFFSKIQKRTNLIWLNPMLLTILTLVPMLLLTGVSFNTYFDSTQAINGLVEPAVVALGFPLYQHLNTIKSKWKVITLLLSLGVIIVIGISLFFAMVLINIPEVAVSLSLKSVTTPIGLSLTEALNGNHSITAFAIIIAGLFGAILGPSWLNLIGVTCAKSQGLAIGAASHAVGTATISKLSYEHSAYGSLALILSAVITAILSPFFIPFLFSVLERVDLCCTFLQLFI